VLVIGAGGLGSPLLLYLAAAGVGRIGVVDDDAVDLSNLQRQVVHDSSKIGMAKTESARARLAEINPEVAVETHQVRVTSETALELVSGYDLVADGSDNFPTRYLVNDACYLARKTLVSAAILRFDGQLATFKAHLREPGAPAAYPCYRCLFGNQPPDTKESCAGVGDSLSGSLLLYDALGATFRKVKVKADPACDLCGPQASIKSLGTVDYREREPICVA
jgi:adenylyltransferase/sulfurtransferase